MTAVSPKHPDRIASARFGPKELIETGPRIVVIERIPNGRLQLYINTFNQHITVRPETPEALWQWCNDYADDPWGTLIACGFEIPVAPTEPQTTIDVSADELLKDLGL